MVEKKKAIVLRNSNSDVLRRDLVTLCKEVTAVDLVPDRLDKAVWHGRVAQLGRYLLGCLYAGSMTTFSNPALRKPKPRRTKKLRCRRQPQFPSDRQYEDLHQKLREVLTWCHRGGPMTICPIV